MNTQVYCRPDLLTFKFCLSLRVGADNDIDFSGEHFANFDLAFAPYVTNCNLFHCCLQTK